MTPPGWLVAEGHDPHVWVAAIFNELGLSTVAEEDQPFPALEYCAIDPEAKAMAERIVLVSMVEVQRLLETKLLVEGIWFFKSGWLQRECRTRRRSECVDDQVSKNDNDFEERNDIQNAQKARLYDGKVRVRRGAQHD
jgi:hypothetical protein